MNEEIIDIPEEKKEDSLLKSALVWWEKKRLWYNILVGASGLVSILIYTDKFNFADFIDLLIYGIVLNGFYSIGFLFEAISSYYSKGVLSLERWRYPLYIIGILFSCILTYLMVVLHYVGFEM